jgi:hypothetical protein
MVRAIVCAALLVTAPARAEPRTDPTIGPAVFTGATMSSATSIALNPAALGLGNVDEFYSAGTAVIDQLGIATRNLDVNTGAVTPGASVHDTQAAPGGMAAVVFHFKDDYTIALAADSTSVALFPTGQKALQYQVLGGKERTYSATLGGSFRLFDGRLYIGISLASQFRDLQLHYARDTALAQGTGAGGITSACGPSPCGVGNPLATEVYDVNVRTPYISLGTLVPNFGVVVQIAKDMLVGLGYHAPPGLALINSLNGTMDIARAPRDGGGELYGGATVNLSEPAGVDFEFRMRLLRERAQWLGPLDLHVGFRWEDLSRFGGYDVRGYGATLAGANIPEVTEKPLDYHDPYAFWAGVEQADSGQDWLVGVRVGFETSSTNNPQTWALAVDPFSVTLNVGVQRRLSLHWVAQATYGLQYFTPVTVTDSSFDPRAQLACEASGFDYGTHACAQVRGGYAVATTADGDYDRWLHAFRLAVRYTF